VRDAIKGLTTADMSVVHVWLSGGSVRVSRIAVLDDLRNRLCSDDMHTDPTRSRRERELEKLIPEHIVLCIPYAC